MIKPYVYNYDDVLDSWQNIVTVMAKILNVPAGLIMRINGTDIEVFVSSKRTGNPYHGGDKEHLIGSGLYCETVINTKSKLLIPNAIEDPLWKNNPDIKLNMISYLGFPILQPDGKVFGTICVLDTKTNAYSPLYESLIYQFKEHIEADLKMLKMNQLLEEQNRKLEKYMTELDTLHGIIPICMSCKKIRDDKGFWQAVENYIAKHPDSEFSHGICPDCSGKYRKQVAQNMAK